MVSAAVTESMDNILLKPIKGRLKAYTMLFLLLLERHDLLLYRNLFIVMSAFLLIVAGEISAHLCSYNYMTGLSLTSYHKREHFSGKSDKRLRLDSNKCFGTKIWKSDLQFDCS